MQTSTIVVNVFGQGGKSKTQTNQAIKPAQELRPPKKIKIGSHKQSTFYFHLFWHYAQSDEHQVRSLERGSRVSNTDLGPPPPDRLLWGVLAVVFVVHIHHFDILLAVEITILVGCSFFVRDVQFFLLAFALVDP